MTVENLSAEPWSSAFTAPVLVGYHWLDGAGAVLGWDNPRSPLPCVVEPGDRVTFPARVDPPAARGACIVEFDLVQEGVFWFAHETPRAIARAPRRSGRAA